MALPFLMLINRQKELDELLLELPNVYADGENLVFEHFYNTAAAERQAYLQRQFSDNGFTQDRSMRLVATIDEADFTRLCLERPELLRDKNALLRYVQSDEGAKYRTVSALKTGRSAQCIVK